MTAADTDPQAACGLCGNTGALIRTRCCDQWICDDEREYMLFSYARNSCSRNHWRYTLCGYHFAEQHDGSWQHCVTCRKAFAIEMYVWYGTNDNHDPSGTDVHQNRGAAFPPDAVRGVPSTRSPRCRCIHAREGKVLV